MPDLDNFDEEINPAEDGYLGGDAHDGPRPSVDNAASDEEETTGITPAEFLAMPDQQRYTEEKRYIQPDIIPLADDADTEEDDRPQIIAEVPKVYLDYFNVLGRPYGKIASRHAPEDNFNFEFAFDAKQWTAPLQLKAGTVPFPTTNSTFYLGECVHGKLFIVWSVEDGDPLMDNVANGGDEGHISKVSHIKVAQGLEVRSHIAKLFARLPELKDRGIFYSEDPEVMRDVYVGSKLNWAAFQALTDGFMATYEAELKPHLGAWGQLRVPRFLMYRYGQNIPVLWNLDDTAQVEAKMASEFGALLFPDLALMEVSWATEMIANDELGRPLPIMIDLAAFKRTVENKDAVQSYPLGFMRRFGNAQSTSSTRWLSKAIGRQNKKIRLASPGAHHPIEFKSLNFYNNMKQKYRRSKKKFSLGQGTYTAGLGITKNMVSPQTYNSTAQTRRRTAAWGGLPTRTFKEALKYTTAKNVGVRLEWTARLKIADEIRTADRTWEFYAKYFLLPTATMIASSTSADSVDRNGTIVALYPGVWPNLLEAHISTLQKPITRILTKYADAADKTLTLREIEIVATCERLMTIAATGSLRPCVKIWDDFSLRSNLQSYNFPFFDHAVFNPFTGDVDFAKYGHDADGRFAHVAAIGFATNRTVEERASGLALIEYNAVRNISMYYGPNSFRGFVSAYVTRMLIPEMVAVARRRWTEHLQEKLRAFPREDLTAVEEARTKHDYALDSLAAWATDKTPLAQKTVMKCLQDVFGPFDDKNQWVASIVENDDEVADVRLPRETYNKYILSYDLVARALVSAAYDPLKSDGSMITTSADLQASLPRDMQAPSMLARLFRLTNAVHTQVSGPPAQKKQRVMSPNTGAPAVTRDQLVMAIADALDDADVETWPSRINNLKQITWKVLHLVAKTPVEALPIKQCRITPVNQLAARFAPAEAGIDNVDVPRGPDADDLAEVIEVQPLSDSLRLAPDSAYFLNQIKLKVNSGVNKNDGIDHTYYNRWNRILSTLDVNNKLIYNFACIFTRRKEHVPWIQENGNLSKYSRATFSTEPTSRSITAQRSPRLIKVLFIAVALYYSTPALHFPIEGSECSHATLIKGWTERKFEVAIFACLGLGTITVARNKHLKIPPPGTGFVPNLSGEHLERTFTAMQEAWAKGNYYAIIGQVYLKDDAVDLINATLPRWTLTKKDSEAWKTISNLIRDKPQGQRNKIKKAVPTVASSVQRYTPEGPIILSSDD
ncbi:hypothetical protein JCM5296_003629 [Sporobolomyces johnsonii]